jgi:hypothetical protein
MSEDEACVRVVALDMSRPEVTGDMPACVSTTRRVHAQVHGRHQRYARRCVLGAPDVRHSDYHHGLAASAFALYRF